MADSRITQIHKKLQELLSVNHATYSNVNLTDRVVRGSVVQPPYTPFGTVFFVDAVESYTGSTLASDGVKAITANRQLALGSLVDDVLVSYTALDGDKYGLSGIGIGMIRINVKFVSDDGT